MRTIYEVSEISYSRIKNPHYFSSFRKAYNYVEEAMNEEICAISIDERVCDSTWYYKEDFTVEEWAKLVKKDINNTCYYNKSSAVHPGYHTKGYAIRAIEVY